jgi:hypothetical protein
LATSDFLSYDFEHLQIEFSAVFVFHQDYRKGDPPVISVHRETKDKENEVPLHQTAKENNI